MHFHMFVKWAHCLYQRFQIRSLCNYLICISDKAQLSQLTNLILCQRQRQPLDLGYQSTYWQDIENSKYYSSQLCNPCLPQALHLDHPFAANLTYIAHIWTKYFAFHFIANCKSARESDLLRETQIHCSFSSWAKTFKDRISLDQRQQCLRLHQANNFETYFIKLMD